MDGLAISAALLGVDKLISGGSIRSIYQPERGSFVVDIFSGREYHLLVSPTATHIHLTELDLPYPKKPSPFVMRLRKALRGGRIVSIKQLRCDRSVTITVNKKRQNTEDRYQLVAELTGGKGNLILLKDEVVVCSLRETKRCIEGKKYEWLPDQHKTDPNQVTVSLVRDILDEDDQEWAIVRRLDGIGKQTAGALLALARDKQNGSLVERVSKSIRSLLDERADQQPQYDPDANWASFFPQPNKTEKRGSFAQALDEEFLVRWEQERRKQAEDGLEDRIDTAIDRRESTLEKLRRSLERTKRVERLRHRADLLMINLGNLPPKIEEAKLLDPKTKQEVVVKLDPALTPVENAQVLYEKAKRIKRGRPKISRRIRKLERELAVLTRGLDCIERNGYPDDVVFKLLGDRSSTPKKREPGQTSPKVYSFEGYRIQVGKDAQQNDNLLRHARPEDLWLHAKGSSGAHVIVSRHGRSKIPQAVLEQAAILAAANSKAKNQGKVIVSHTLVKHVRKPRGSRPGLVIVDKEDTLIIDMDDRGE